MCSVSHSERQGSSSCDLNVDRPALLLCRVISMSRAVNLAPQEPSRAEAGGLRASRVRDLATALSLVALGSTAEARGGAAPHAVLVGGGFGCPGGVCVCPALHTWVGVGE